MDKDSKFILRKIIIDVIVVACVAVPILCFYIWGKPFERGFFCDDESLRHPFHKSTVTSLMLYMVGLGFPILLMAFTEFTIHKRRKNQKTHHFMGYEIPPWIWASYNVIGVFGFGVACQQLTTDIAKYSVGRLRPHFFDVCKPNIDCSLAENQWRYITNFTCMGTDPYLIKEMRLSFPSGHSSFSTFTMLYVAIYLQCKMKWAGSKLLRHILQFIVLMLAWATIMSRVANYKHHWSDVLGGACVGAVTAFIVFLCISDLQQPRKQVTDHIPDRTENPLFSGNTTTNGNSNAAV